MITDSRNSLPVLPQIKINTPCPMNWDEMDGDASRRFCGHCQKHVHNFEEMDADSVNTLLESVESICAKISRRTDGSIVTKETCISRRSWFARIGAMAASVIAILTQGGCQEPVENIMGGMDALPASQAPMLLGEVDCSELGDVVFVEQQPVLEPLQEQDVKRELGKIAPTTPPAK